MVSRCTSMPMPFRFTCTRRPTMLLAKLDITHVRVSPGHSLRLSLSAHVTAVCRSSYYQLRQRQAVRSFSEDASKTLVQAIVSCRLDYCNSLFFFISEGLMNWLQSVQNAAARLGTGTRRSDHIASAPSATLAIPVRQRVHFNVATFQSLFCLVFRHRTWPTTAVLSPMLVTDDYVLQRTEHVSLGGHAAPLATERSRLLDPD